MNLLHRKYNLTRYNMLLTTYSRLPVNAIKKNYLQLFFKCADRINFLQLLAVHRT